MQPLKQYQLHYQLHLVSNDRVEQTMIRIYDDRSNTIFAYDSNVAIWMVSAPVSILDILEANIEKLRRSANTSSRPLTATAVSSFNSGKRERTALFTFAASPTFPVEQLGFFTTALVELAVDNLFDRQPIAADQFVQKHFASRVSMHAITSLASFLAIGTQDKIPQHDLISSFSTTLADFLICKCAVPATELFDHVNHPLIQSASQAGLLATSEDFQKLLEICRSQKRPTKCL